MHPQRRYSRITCFTLFRSIRKPYCTCELILLDPDPLLHPRHLLVGADRIFDSLLNITNLYTCFSRIRSNLCDSAQLCFLFCDRITRIRALVALVPRVQLASTSQTRSLANYSRTFVHQWNSAAASLLQRAYLGRSEGKRKGDGWVVFKLLAAGRKGDPYSVRENYEILFFAHSLLRLLCPKRSSHAVGFSHALTRNYRCRDYREGRARLLFCGRALNRWPRATRGFFCG